MWQALIKLIEKWACRHKWDKYTGTKSFEKGAEYPHTITDTLICKHCGRITQVNI